MTFGAQNSLFIHVLCHIRGRECPERYFIDEYPLPYSIRFLGSLLQECVHKYLSILMNKHKIETRQK